MNNTKAELETLGTKDGAVERIANFVGNHLIDTAMKSVRTCMMRFVGEPIYPIDVLKEAEK